MGTKYNYYMGNISKKFHGVRIISKTTFERTWTSETQTAAFGGQEIRGLQIFSRNSNAENAILVAHGGFSEKTKNVKIPVGLSLLFEVEHGKSGNGIGHAQTTLQSHAKTYFEKISGGNNSPNYEFEYYKYADELFPGTNCDLIVLKKGFYPKLSDIFIARQILGKRWKDVHIDCCRTPFE